MVIDTNRLIKQDQNLILEGLVAMPVYDIITIINIFIIIIIRNGCDVNDGFKLVLY